MTSLLPTVRSLRQPYRPYADLQADPSVFYPDPKLRYPRAVTYLPHPDTPPQDRLRVPYDARWSVFVPRYLPARLRNKGIHGEKGEVVRWWKNEEGRRAKALRSAGICLVSSETSASMRRCRHCGCHRDTYWPRCRAHRNSLTAGKKA